LLFDSRRVAIAFVDDFNRSAELYEMYQAPFSNLVSPKIVTLAKLSSGQDVLDVGTGTGSAALAAARTVGRNSSVTGIDLADGMLAIAKRKARAEGLDNLHFEKMNAESLDFADGSFDAVISNLGIPAYCYPQTISEVFRVLRNGGKLCFAEVTRTSPSWSLFSKALLKYRVQNPPLAVVARRRAREAFQKASGKYPFSVYAPTLRHTGFARVRTVRDNFAMTQPPAEGCLRYYSTREDLEYNAMPEQSRESFDGEILRGLELLRKRYHGIVKRQVKFWMAEKSKH